MELLYSGKGVKTEAPIVKYRYFYADIPLYLQYNVNDNIRFNFGGQYSIFTNAVASQIDGSNSSGVNNIKLNNIKNTDYGFLFGLEADLNDRLAICGRYTISGSTFFEKNKTNFGVFNLTFNYNLHTGYKQIFGTKSDEK